MVQHFPPQHIIEQIAKQHLDVDTLDTRQSDRLDFHDVSVWGIKNALTEAYAAGQASSDESLDVSSPLALKSSLMAEVYSAAKVIQADYLRQQRATLDFSEKNIFAEGRVALEHLLVALEIQWSLTVEKTTDAR